MSEPAKSEPISPQAKAAEFVNEWFVGHDEYLRPVAVCREHMLKLAVEELICETAIPLDDLTLAPPKESWRRHAILLATQILAKLYREPPAEIGRLMATLNNVFLTRDEDDPPHGFWE